MMYILDTGYKIAKINNSSILHFLKTELEIYDILLSYYEILNATTSI